MINKWGRIHKIIIRAGSADCLLGRLQACSRAPDAQTIEWGCNHKIIISGDPVFWGHFELLVYQYGWHGCASESLDLSTQPHIKSHVYKRNYDKPETSFQITGQASQHPTGGISSTILVLQAGTIQAAANLEHNRNRMNLDLSTQPHIKSHVYSGFMISQNQLPNHRTSQPASERRHFQYSSCTTSRHNHANHIPETPIG